MNQGPPPNMMGGPGKGPGPQPNVPPQAANPTPGPRPHTSPHYLKQHLQVCKPTLYRSVLFISPQLACTVFHCYVIK
jgi:hypothetical protein